MKPHYLDIIGNEEWRLYIRGGPILNGKRPPNIKRALDLVLNHNRDVPLKLETTRWYKNRTTSVTKDVIVL